MRDGSRLFALYYLFYYESYIPYSYIFSFLPNPISLLFLQLSLPLLFPSYVSFRSIYDDQPNAHKRFMEKLDARIRNHDREIEKMCNFHHQGFVDAITELLKVRSDAEKLMVREISAKRITDPIDDERKTNINSRHFKDIVPFKPVTIQLIIIQSNPIN